MNLSWKYSFSSHSLKISDGEKQVGFLKANIWKPFFAQGQLFGKQYIFKPTRFFSGVILIINAETLKREGYLTRSLNSTIHLEGDLPVKMNFRNFWMTKWRLVGNQAYRIHFDGGYFGGNFLLNEGVPTSIILASFYVRNKIWELGFFSITILTIWTAIRSL